MPVDFPAGRAPVRWRGSVCCQPESLWGGNDPSRGRRFLPWGQRVGVGVAGVPTAAAVAFNPILTVAVAPVLGVLGGQQIFTQTQGVSGGVRRLGKHQIAIGITGHQNPPITRRPAQHIRYAFRRFKGKGGKGFGGLGVRHRPAHRNAKRAAQVLRNLLQGALTPLPARIDRRTVHQIAGFIPALYRHLCRVGRHLVRYAVQVAGDDRLPVKGQHQRSAGAQAVGQRLAGHHDPEGKIPGQTRQPAGNTDRKPVGENPVADAQRHLSHRAPPRARPPAQTADDAAGCDE